MIKICVTDIFGKTPALISIANIINADVIVDPYDGKNMNFTSEAQAYSFFTENIGIDNYKKKLESALNNCSEEYLLVGFSMGASIIWMLSGSVATELSNRIKYAVCYYGAQIRYYSDVSPKFAVKCIFPKSEFHFNVSILHKILEKKEKVTSMQVDYLHGFMNVHSNNYDHVGFDTHMSLLRQDFNL